MKENDFDTLMRVVSHAVMEKPARRQKLIDAAFNGIEYALEDQKQKTYTQFRARECAMTLLVGKRVDRSTKDKLVQDAIAGIPENNMNMIERRFIEKYTKSEDVK